MIVIGTDTHKRTHTCGAVNALTAAERGELTAPARRGSIRQAAAVGADARPRAGVGDRGLPARLRRARAVPDRPRRADRSRRPEAHGRRKALFARARQVRLDRRVQRRACRAQGRNRQAPRSAPRRRGARHSPAGRPSRGPGRRPRAGSATAALASARPVARARDPARRTRHGQVAREGLPPPRPRRAEHTRAGRARARAPDHREHQAHPRARSRARRARPGLRAAAARRARLRPAHRRQADRRDRRRRPLPTDAKLARTSGSAPIPASSGNTQRHRPDRGGTASSTALFTASL